jgi:NOL1/NOP2/sun family putative RNA methylase
MQLPEKFLQNIQELLGDDSAAFVEALATKSPVSIRLNPTKSFDGFESNEAVQWNSAGRYLPERPIFTLDPAFHAGAYYVQEASSMFIAEALKQTIDFDKSLMIMDLCAAPGGKTTTIASLLNEESIIVANEVIKSRVGVLKENLEKWGFPNYIVTSHDAEEMIEMEGFFDVVLVDAPCSGEGLFRKDPNAINEWSEENVAICSARQKRILQAAALLVKPNGILIYSTCTYNEAENQQNTDWICQTNDFEAVKLKLPAEWQITETKSGYQFFPHKTKGEGFFCSVLKKTQGDTFFIEARIKLNRLPSKYLDEIKNWLHSPADYEFYLKSDQLTIVALKRSLATEYGTIIRGFSKRSSGLEIGMFKGTDFIPSHALALSSLIKTDLPAIDLEKDAALKFLKREDFETDYTNQGWALVRYKSLNLGWVKVLSGRINNYLPKEWRIRMDIEE